jgi:hypothetical protein
MFRALLLCSTGATVGTWQCCHSQQQQNTLLDWSDSRYFAVLPLTRANNPFQINSLQRAAQINSLQRAAQIRLQSLAQKAAALQGKAFRVLQSAELVFATAMKKSFRAR